MVVVASLKRILGANGPEDGSEANVLRPSLQDPYKFIEYIN